MWRNPAFHRFLDALLLLAIVIVALFPLVSGTNTMKWDATDLYLPWKYYVTECFANGELPLWNPFINSGFPQMADPGSWYPVSWILAWLGGGYSLNVLHWEYIIHLFIGGFGMYSLLRHYGFQRWILLSVATAFMLSGLMIGNAQHIGWIVGASWFPWAYLYERKMLLESSWINPIKLALALFLMISGGYPAVFIITAYILLIKTVTHYTRKWKSNEKDKLKSATLRGLTMLFIFLMLSLIVILPALELGDYISRGSLNERQDIWNMLIGSIHPSASISFILPLATAVNDQGLWGADFSMVNLYFGAILFLMLLLGLVLKSSRNASLKYIIVGLVLLSFTFGEHLPFRSWLGYLPMMDTFRFPAIFRLFAIFFFLIGTAQVLKEISLREDARKILAYTFAIAAGLFAIILMILYGGVERWKILKIAEEGWLHFMSIASVKELVFFQLGILFGFCLLLFIIVNWARINWLLPLAVMVIFEGVLFTRMQMTVTVSADRQSAEVSRGMQDAPEGFPTPTMDPLTDFSDSILSRKHTVLWKNLAMLQKRPSCDGVSPYSLKTTELAAEKGYLEKMVQLPYVFTFEGFSEYREIHWNTIDYLNEQGLTIKKFNPNETELIIKASKSDGKRYVCLNQNWYPYWEAKVDGKSTEILRVNKSFIAIEVPKKASKLSFKFNPVSYRGLAQLSFALFVILLGVLCALSLKKILPTRS